MLAIGRLIPHGDAAVRRGDWDGHNHLIGVELAGHTLGIISLWRIGGRITRICALGFQMRVI